MINIYNMYFYYNIFYDSIQVGGENMTKVLYPGSFDPMTKGHMNIVEQTIELFDEIVIAIIGVLLVEFGLICFNKYVLMSLPLVARMILMIVMYWMIALVPIIFCLKNKCKLNDVGLTKNKLGKQIIIGIIM